MGNLFLMVSLYGIGFLISGVGWWACSRMTGKKKHSCRALITTLSLAPAWMGPETPTGHVMFPLYVFLPLLAIQPFAFLACCTYPPTMVSIVTLPVLAYMFSRNFSKSDSGRRQGGTAAPSKRREQGRVKVRPRH
jgi:hypothetical protein